VLYTHGFEIPAIASADNSLSRIPLPELDELLANGDSRVPVFPFDKVWQDNRLDPCMIVQSSTPEKSTNVLTLSHANFAMVLDHHSTLPLHGKRPYTHVLTSAARVYNALPIFSSASIYLSLVQSIYFGQTIVFGPAKPALPSVVDMGQMFEYAAFDALIAAPSTLEHIYRKPHILESLGRLNLVTLISGML
jgi:hypothetical protein